MRKCLCTMYGCEGLSLIFNPIKWCEMTQNWHLTFSHRLIWKMDVWIVNERKSLTRNMYVWLGHCFFWIMSKTLFFEFYFWFSTSFPSFSEMNENRLDMKIEWHMFAKAQNNSNVVNFGNSIIMITEKLFHFVYFSVNSK